MVAEKKYNRGYRSKLDKNQLKAFNQKFNQQSIIIPVLYISIYYLSIYLLCRLLHNVLSYTYLFYSLFFIFSIIIARQLRALENIVHFGSHYNITLKKDINDKIVNIFCAFPVMQEIKSYRSFHLKHHNKYGSNTDPCKIRFEDIGTSSSNSLAGYFLFIVASLPKYFYNYYKQIGTNFKLLGIYIAYHIILFTVNSTMVDINFAIIFLVTYNFSLFMILPVIRSVAEYDEHNYKCSDSLVGTTFNNLTIIDHLLFHPTGDAYHVVHHLFPAIPWWKQKEAHRYLLNNDEAYNDLVNNRTKLIHKLSIN